MTAAKRGRKPARRSQPTPPPQRYTIDASVFVNAFNQPQQGHAASLALLTAINESGDPVVLPSLAVVEIASAMARAADDAEGAVAFAAAATSLPHVMVVPLSAPAGRQAAELAASHRLRGADAIYAWVARRYGTTLVTRDEQQRARAAPVVTCLTPEEAMSLRS